MSYLDRLKKSANAGGGTLQNHQNLETGGFVGFEGTPSGPFQKIEGARAANDPAPKPRPAPLPNASTVWLIQHVDRRPLEVHFWPPATRAEVLTDYPTAINVEPMQAPHSAEAEPDKAQPHQEDKAPPAPDAGRWRAGPAALLARSCRTCQHLLRPGLSDGHCGGRDDLPPAYTAGHPLRLLPDDGGANCTTWELAT